jgi:ribosomal protein S18 acetylase RimI-like enzyme
MNIIVRPIEVDDAGDIVNIQKSTWLDTYPNIEHKITKKDILKMFSNINERVTKISNIINNYGDRSAGWIAIYDGKPAGFVAVEKSENKNDLKAIYVLPKFQNIGVGKDLMNKVFDFFPISETIWIEVANYNHKAIKFYQKHGFEFVPNSADKYEIIAGKFIPRIKMKRVV